MGDSEKTCLNSAYGADTLTVVTYTKLTNHSAGHEQWIQTKVVWANQCLEPKQAAITKFAKNENIELGF